MKFLCIRLVKNATLTGLCIGLVSCSSGAKNQPRGQDMASVGSESTIQSRGYQADVPAKPLGCPSKVTLDLKSSNYSGLINIEFRSGKRPGSKRLHTAKVNTSGIVTIENVCAGKYFFAFSTPDSPSVSVTSYFDVINNGSQYSNPRITVTYTRAASKNAVQTVGRGSL